MKISVGAAGTRGGSLRSNSLISLVLYWWTANQRRIHILCKLFPSFCELRKHVTIINLFSPCLIIPPHHSCTFTSLSHLVLAVVWSESSLLSREASHGFNRRQSSNWTSIDRGLPWRWPNFVAVFRFIFLIIDARRYQPAVDWSSDGFARVEVTARQSPHLT